MHYKTLEFEQPERFCQMGKGEPWTEEWDDVTCDECHDYFKMRENYEFNPSPDIDPLTFS